MTDKSPRGVRSKGLILLGVVAISDVGVLKLGILSIRSTTNKIKCVDSASSTVVPVA